MKYKVLIFTVAIFLSVANIFALTAKDIIQDAVDQSSTVDSLAQVINTVEKKLSVVDTDSDRRSVYTFLAFLAEQQGNYQDACKWYATAAGIAAPPAAGTPAMTSEQLVLAAVRSALSGGDYETAETYLASIRSSKNQETSAYVKLYTVWSWLSRAETKDDFAESVALLESYATMQSLILIRPSVYLTLWYLTGQEKWSVALEKEFPDSPECAMVKGNGQLLPSPFWFFMPKENTEQAIASESTSTQSQELKKSDSDDVNKGSSSADVIICQQLGFFRNRENAERLAQRLKDAGFSSNITEEKRASGTTYFVVTVPEDSSGTMGLKLKTAGFECYPVFAE